MTDNVSGEPVVRKKKKRLPLFVWLAYGLVATLLFVGVTFSSYVTTSSSLDQARVAKFNVTEQEMVNVEVEITPYEPAYFPFEVVNDSEVAVKYTVTVEKLTNNVPLLFKLHGFGSAVDALEKKGETKYTLSKDSNPGEQVTYKLEMLLDGNDLSYMGMVEHIRVTVDAVQID